MKISSLAYAVALAWDAAAPACARLYHYNSPTPHIFSINDIMGGFDGSTFGPGVKQNNMILCNDKDDTTMSPCPKDGPQPIDDSGDTLYPIDSDFGFDVTDFVGAETKYRDLNYEEGFAGDIMENNQVIGVKVSNAATVSYKVKPPLGTWCQGLGDTSVKCSTEHFTVMEHVLTCWETVPYFFAEPDYPYNGDEGYCEELDNELFTPGEGDDDDKEFSDNLDDLEPNDNTNLVDIAFSSDYSITKKDDGKVLYRWGSLIKRPTDIRLYAKLELPVAWKNKTDDGKFLNNFYVTKAHLVVEHLITNNPNDQLRAEDMENEGATGRTPGYVELDDGSWESITPCYEGDGDFIDGEDGTSEATEIPTGTLFKQPSDFILQGDSPPELFSEDLKNSKTNAWYTTIDRDPFEWSYRQLDVAPDVHKYEGHHEPLTASEEVQRNVELVSGPRWRLTANKFGQDIPALEIPTDTCVPPPYQNGMKKYVVGERTTTTINLLDYEGVSPLARSQGWVDYTQNIAVNDIMKEEPFPDDFAITINGLPMTEDFDLAVYIKGDRKPTALFNARLVIEYTDDLPEESGGGGSTDGGIPVETYKPCAEYQANQCAFDAKSGEIFYSVCIQEKKHYDQECLPESDIDGLGVGDLIAKGKVIASCGCCGNNETIVATRKSIKGDKLDAEYCQDDLPICDLEEWVVCKTSKSSLVKKIYICIDGREVCQDPWEAPEKDYDCGRCAVLI